MHHYHRAYGRSQFFNFPRIYRTAIDVAEALVRARHPAHASSIRRRKRGGRGRAGHARVVSPTPPAISTAAGG